MNLCNQDKVEKKIVLSASRRTDLVSCYPGFLTEKLQKYPPEKVHTVVLWTKNPQNLINRGKLRDAILGYSQVYIHYTITGLGGSILEPQIPDWKTAVRMIPCIIELTGSAERVSWRFDPVIKFKDGNGQLTSNFDMFDALAKEVAFYGLRTCRTSWVEAYRKVIRRVEKAGLSLILPSNEEKREQAAILAEKASQKGLSLYFCSVQGMCMSSCIDGRFFNRIHPAGFTCSEKKAKGQRKLCGCTESLDIGWYSLKCENGCLYCYGET